MLATSQAHAIHTHAAGNRLMTDTIQEEIWVVDDDQSMRWVLQKALNSDEHPVVAFSGVEAATEALESARPRVLITDLRMPDGNGLDLLGSAASRYPKLPVIIITAYSDIESAVTAFDHGAFEYLPKPFDVRELKQVVDRAWERHAVNPAPDVELRSGMVGESPAMQRVFRTIARLSRSNLSVLLTGETGTGKELAARAVHDHSPRRNGPFVALNTAAIPQELLESELFGHEKGAFTGAQKQHLGRFEQANGGTLFLDEIGDMPLDLQTRLLRVLAENEFYRLGGHALIKVDVRVVAATHQDLEQKVENGSFRADLLHRLNVVRIELPPLRERKDDIDPLMEHFLQFAALETNLERKQITEEAMHLIRAHTWPGNVRELRNLCRRLTVMAPGTEIRPSDLPSDISGSDPQVDPSWHGALAEWAREALRSEPSQLLAQAQDELQAVMFRAALEETQGHRQAAAKLLGCGRNTLARRLKELGLDA